MGRVTTLIGTTKGWAVPVGGLTTKIHLVGEGGRRPLAVLITLGQGRHAGKFFSWQPPLPIKLRFYSRTPRKHRLLHVPAIRSSCPTAL